MRCVIRKFLLLGILVSATIYGIPPRESFGDEYPDKQPEKVMPELERLAKRMRWLNPAVFGGRPGLWPGGGKEYVAVLKRLAQQSRDIPLDAAKSKDPAIRGLVGLIFGLSEDLSRVAAAVDLLKDETDTGLRSVPMATALYGREPVWDKAIKLDVSDMVRKSLTYRWVGGSALSGFPFETNKKADLFMEALLRERGGTGDWVYRFRRARSWGLDRDALKKELLKSKDPLKGIAAAAVASVLTDQFTEDEIVLALRDTDKTKLREFLQNKWRMATMTLQSGPYSKDQIEVRHVLLRAAPKVLSKDDAQWVYDAARPTEWVSVHYIIAAAKLDPDKGVGWLKNALVKERDQKARWQMLEALWAVGGESQMSYIKDRYFAEKKSKYSAGGLQGNLIMELGKNEGDKAAGLLKAFILDNRFTTLGWAATRAFAKNGKIILGQETKEVKRYLSVQHRMGVDSFERQLNEREKYPVDTKHVLMQTEAFQIYLQGEVLKRSKMGHQ